MILNKIRDAPSLRGDSDSLIKAYYQLVSGSPGDTGVVILADFEALNTSGSNTRMIAIKAAGDIQLATQGSKIEFPDGTSLSSGITTTTDIDLTSTQYSFLYVDATSDTININLPYASTFTLNEMKIIRIDTNTANVVNIIPKTGDSIMGLSSYYAQLNGNGVISFYSNRKTKWICSVFGANIGTI